MYTANLTALLYGCEKWTMISVGWHNLKVFHLRCQCRILGIKWSDFLHNNKVQAASGQDCLENTIHSRAGSQPHHIHVRCYSSQGSPVYHLRCS